MKILHYALGFPPYRSGGLTKFCMDLMMQQHVEGHHVGLIWPGKMGAVSRNVFVKNRGIANINGKKSGIYSFEVINPLPVSYDEGISNFEAFTFDNGYQTYSDFLDSYKPDIIHIQTLMGLHKSFLIAAKEKKIKLVFTAHDFFPICPKVTMFRNGSICDCVNTYLNCGICNSTALSIKKIEILQSPLYRSVKNLPLVKKARKKHRDEYLSGGTSKDCTETVGNAQDFKKLRDYYFSLLYMMDIIHYNSSVTKAVYEEHYHFNKSCIIGISHADIVDHRHKKSFDSDILRIRYLGPQGEAKGYYLLKKALDRLWEENQRFCLDVHFTPKVPAPYIKTHERYAYYELQEIFESTDVLVVPSIWYETFGYTALEALSYGVPVILSGHVGAKDILADGAGIVIDNMDENGLYEELKCLTVNCLKTMNSVILEKQFIVTLSDMARQIEQECYKR